MSGAVRIRAAGPADAPALARLAADTFGLACPPHTTLESQRLFISRVLSIERFEEYLAHDARTLLMAYRGPDATDAEPIGYSMLVAGEPDDADVAIALTHRPTIELSKIYVRAEQHGQGVADALMDASLDAARARGDSAGVWLGVNQLNARAQAFYRRSGFVVVGEKRFLVGETYEHDYLFERAL